MEELQPIYRQEEARGQLLRLFGVTEEPFLDASRLAWLEWAARTEFDPPSFPGTVLWGHTVRHERRQLVELGWAQNDVNNFSTCITPDGKMAIAVETGDEYTATTIPEKTPRTNSRKGPQTMQMIRDNSKLLQGNLFAGFAQAEPVRSQAPLLWIHLIHQSMGDVLGEISLPVVADDDQRIVGWKSRIILPRVEGGSDPRRLSLPAPEVTPDSEVRVVRRLA